MTHEMTKAKETLKVKVTLKKWDQDMKDLLKDLYMNKLIKWNDTPRNIKSCHEEFKEFTTKARSMHLVSIYPGFFLRLGYISANFHSTHYFLVYPDVSREGECKMDASMEYHLSNIMEFLGFLICLY